MTRQDLVHLGKMLVLAVDFYVVIMSGRWMMISLRAAAQEGTEIDFIGGILYGVVAFFLAIGGIWFWRRMFNEGAGEQ